jgi:hypothetical protein
MYTSLLWHLPSTCTSVREEPRAAFALHEARGGGEGRRRVVGEHRREHAHCRSEQQATLKCVTASMEHGKHTKGTVQPKRTTWWVVGYFTLGDSATGAIRGCGSKHAHAARVAIQPLAVQIARAQPSLHQQPTHVAKASVPFSVHTMSPSWGQPWVHTANRLICRTRTHTTK